MTDPTMALMVYLYEFRLGINRDFWREGIRALIQRPQTAVG
jgi:hypothetical protein